MWWWRWNGKRSDVYGGEWWDVVGDLNSVRSVDRMDSDGVEALRMGHSGSKVILAAVGRKRQRLRFTRRWRRSTWWSGR